MYRTTLIITVALLTPVATIADDTAKIEETVIKSPTTTDQTPPEQGAGGQGRQGGESNRGRSDGKRAVMAPAVDLRETALGLVSVQEPVQGGECSEWTPRRSIRSDLPSAPGYKPAVPPPGRSNPWVETEADSRGYRTLRRNNKTNAAKHRGMLFAGY